MFDRERESRREEAGTFTESLAKRTEMAPSGWQHREDPTTVDVGQGRSATALEERVLTAGSNSAAVADLLDLLSDDFARGILAAVDEEPRTARELTADVDASRPTVYRRLQRLQDHGLVEADLQTDADGHHRDVFESRLERVAFGLEDGSPSVTVVVRVDDTARSTVSSRGTAD